MGVFAIRTGRLDEAKSFFSLAVALNPNDSRSLTDLGVLSQKEGDQEGAMHFFELAHQRNTNDVVAAHNYAVVLLQGGRYTEAVDALVSADDFTMVQPDDLKTDIRILLGYRRPDFWRYLNHYRQFSARPLMSEISSHLEAGWGLLSEEQKNSTRTWATNFWRGPDRTAFETCLNKVDGQNGKP